MADLHQNMAAVGAEHHSQVVGAAAAAAHRRTNSVVVLLLLHILPRSYHRSRPPLLEEVGEGAVVAELLWNCFGQALP